MYMYTEAHNQRRHMRVQSFHSICLQTIRFISVCENKDALSAAQSLCVYFLKYCVYNLILITKYVLGRNINRIDF